MTGEQLFKSIMPEKIVARTDTTDVLQRMYAYQGFAKSREESIKIYQTELPEMYNDFVSNEPEYLKLMIAVIKDKANYNQRIRYHDLSDRRTELGVYIRKCESYFRDIGNFKTARELESIRKAMGIQNSDLY